MERRDEESSEKKDQREIMRQVCTGVWTLTQMVDSEYKKGVEQGRREALSEVLSWLESTSKLNGFKNVSVQSMYLFLNNSLNGTKPSQDDTLKDFQLHLEINDRKRGPPEVFLKTTSDEKMFDESDEKEACLKKFHSK